MILVPEVPNVNQSNMHSNYDTVIYIKEAIGIVATLPKL